MAGTIDCIKRQFNSIEHFKENKNDFHKAFSVIRLWPFQRNFDLVTFNNSNCLLILNIFFANFKCQKVDLKI